MFISPRLFVGTAHELAHETTDDAAKAAQMIAEGTRVVVPDLATALAVLALLGASEDRLRYVATYRSGRPS